MTDNTQTKALSKHQSGASATSTSRTEIDLKQAVLHDTEALQQAFAKLQHVVNDRIKERLSVRNHIMKNPMGWVIGSFLVGLWLSQRHRPSSPSSPRRPHDSTQVKKVA